MYKQNKFEKTTLEVDETTEGETIETKIERILNNKEPISDGAPTIYTERKDGVLPEYNIRTDRFDVAVEAMDAVSKANTAKRQARMKVEKSDKSTKNEGDNDGGAEPTQGTTKTSE